MRRLLATLLLSFYVLVAGATTHVNDSGTWRALQGVYVNDSGTWREIQEVYVNDGGTWRSVFTNAVVALDASYAAQGIETDLAPEIAINNDGTTSWTIGNSGTWVTPGGTAAQFEGRMSYVSGAAISGGAATETWLSLGTSRTWTSGDASLGFTATYTLQIRRASDSVVVDTATVTFTVS